MNSTKRVNLALQGGGSHGAFTWGVLDALIEDGRLEFEALSGTSAGAINAAIMMQGWSQGGGPGAREALRAFWGELGTMAVASPIQRTPLDRLQGNWNLDDSPAALWADLIQRTLSPWQRNPLKFDPLRELLRRHFDEKAVRACQEIKVFIAATNVQTGKVRIFTRDELSIDALLASACLPNVHDAVVIDGVPYWDGGFRGNPPIWPFIYNCESGDVVLVEEGAITGEFGGRLKHMLVHSIADPASLAPLGAVSKFNIEPEFLKHLFDLGHAAATAWLATAFDSVGVQSTLD